MKSLLRCLPKADTVDVSDGSEKKERIAHSFTVESTIDVNLTYRSKPSRYDESTPSLTLGDAWKSMLPTKDGVIEAMSNAPPNTVEVFTLTQFDVEPTPVTIRRRVSTTQLEPLGAVGSPGLCSPTAALS